MAQYTEMLVKETIERLREELRLIDQIILQFESIAENKPRRGRPPKVLSDLNS